MASIFRASKLQLCFRNGVGGREDFQFNWTPSTRHGITMTHNLPSSFQITPNVQTLYGPCQITVRYTTSGGLLNDYEPFFIRFTDTQAPADECNPYTVHVTMEGIEFRNHFMDPDSPIFGTIARSPSRSAKVVKAPAALLQSATGISPECEALGCKICYQPYSEDVWNTTPRILTSCGHTLCHECAVNVFKASGSINIPCPLCRVITTELPLELSKNYTVIDLIGVISKKEEPAVLDDNSNYWETTENPCFEDSQHESTRYCTTCKESFCERCFEIIHTPKIFSEHQWIPVDQKPFMYELCSIHPTNFAEYMCRYEKCTEETKLCCRDCLKDSPHKSHKDYVHDLKLVTDQTQGTLTSLLQKLELIEAETSKLLDTAKECSSSYEKSSIEYKSAVTTISNNFDQRKRAALADLDQFLNKSKAKFYSHKQKIVGNLQEIIATKQKIENALKNKKELCDARDLIEEGDAICTLNPGEGVTFTKHQFPNLDDFIKRTEGTINEVDPPMSLSRTKRFENRCNQQ